jgi:dATP pyrophosphohydrolase
MQAKQFRRPVSVLVVVFTDEAEILLLRRAKPFDFWQSITGSLQATESHAAAAKRELFEETGLSDEGVMSYSGVSRQFVIDPRWRDRFEPGAIENVEFEWHYRLPARADIAISAAEHSDFVWMPVEFAAERVWSWTNRDALQGLQP